ncbi:MAG TPA: hypothetical protein VFE78_32455, partial [Gemmataceae bacterium]|nr:hypothetical protein [Gemmataceae bacterium]
MNGYHFFSNGGGDFTMRARMSKAVVLLGAIVLLGVPAPARAAEPTDKERHLLYVVAPGIRNYLEFGGAGI